MNQRLVISSILIVFSNCLFCSIKDSSFLKTITHSASFGIANQKYTANGWIDGAYGSTKTEVSSRMPAWSLHYDIERNFGRNWGLQTGVSATFAQFRINNTDFISPNILNGYVNRKILHQYLSMPVNVYWQVPISEYSNLQVYGGLESMYKLKFEQQGNAFGSLYRTDGSSINSFGINNVFRGESLSWFRVFNLGMRFRFNTQRKNRIAIGLNYNLMRSYWPLEIRTNFNIANTNFYTENHFYFSGLRFNLGYYW